MKQYLSYAKCLLCCLFFSNEDKEKKLSMLLWASMEQVMKIVFLMCCNIICAANQSILDLFCISLMTQPDRSSMVCEATKSNEIYSGFTY
jgi:hypothetical protein